MSKLLTYIVAEGVATLKINRPAKRNVMTFSLLSDFISMLTAAGEDPATKVFIINGVPDSFRAGIDLSDLSIILGKQPGLRSTAKNKREMVAHC
jgi:enoyl-CoA hydratase/carnithine racemase